MAKRKRRAYTGPIYHNHHIVYEGEQRPEWTINLRSWQHKSVTLLSQLKATPEHYAEAINFQTAINDIVNRMRMRLDTEGEE
jgi:hypothetical protein